MHNEYMLLFCNVTLWFSSSKVGGGVAGGGKLVLKIGGTSGVSRILQTEAKGGGNGGKWSLKNSRRLAPETVGKLAPKSGGRWEVQSLPHAPH